MSMLVVGLVVHKGAHVMTLTRFELGDNRIYSVLAIGRFRAGWYCTRCIFRVLRGEERLTFWSVKPGCGFSRPVAS